MTAFTPLDWLAVAWFLIAWLGFNVLVELSPLKHRTLSMRMETYRYRWMQEMAARQVRIMDTAILTGLQQGTAFFASTALLAIGGAFTLLDAADRIVEIAGDLSVPVEANRVLWEVKVLGLMLIFAYAFFKFSWAYRLFNYASIVMGAVPDSVTGDPEELARTAHKAGRLNALAGRHFNRGQRAFFFSIGFMGWFAGPHALAVTTLLVLIVLLRRQFASNAREAIMISEQAPPAAIASMSGEKTDTGSANPFT
ncbi:DUF599 family protein [Microvirga tunisiensis]|uniref:DUF599 family protein n=1 Tax=Pannonibacter tanglangensis TaxID=2750084 RepID=A0A7X5F0C2_9HYPH|nr:DUF599 family protein [Pannonibacter sp. XCT-53]NBN77383.1 DUF599 family protein [Pannonibacter sp. XCT-53]